VKKRTTCERERERRTNTHTQTLRTGMPILEILHTTGNTHAKLEVKSHTRTTKNGGAHLGECGNSAFTGSAIVVREGVGKMHHVIHRKAGKN